MNKTVALGIVMMTVSLTGAAVSAPYHYLPVDHQYPPMNTSPGCDAYNQLHIGDRIDQLSFLNPTSGLKEAEGHTYQWTTASGYQFAMDFFNNGLPIQPVSTTPARFMYVPSLKKDQVYYGYGVITPNERKWIYLVSQHRANLVVTQQLLGSTGRIIGSIAVYQWAQHPEQLIVSTDEQHYITDFSISAFCKNNAPLIQISDLNSVG